MDNNHEEVFDLLQQFEEKYSDGKIPEPLENYLKHIAKTGDILFPWPSIKPLLRKKIENVLDEFNEKSPVSTSCPNFNFEEMKQEIIKTLDAFYGPPFTIQRICELLTVPNKHYKRTDKFMRGLEKNVLVVSHIDTRSPTQAQAIPPAPKSIFSTDAFNTFGSDGDYSSLSSSSRSSVVDPFENPEPGTSSGSSNLASNKIIVPSCNIHRPSSPNCPAPLQQLDSFTTVFSSPPSTPLAVVTNMAPFESASSSSSGSSSSDGSSTGSSPRPLDEGSPESKDEGHEDTKDEGHEDTKDEGHEDTKDEGHEETKDEENEDSPSSNSPHDEPMSTSEEPPLAPQPSEPTPLEPTNVTPTGTAANGTSTNETSESTLHSSESSAADQESVEMPLQSEQVELEPVVSEQSNVVEPMLLEQENVKPSDSVPALEPVEQKTSEPIDVPQPATSEPPREDQVQAVENPKTILETLPSIDV